MWKIKIYPERCIGCKLCELACSYHHTKVFGRRFSSIEVHIFKKDDVNVKITLHQERRENHVPCDGCKNEKEPLCVKYCPTKVLIARSLK